MSRLKFEHYGQFLCYIKPEYIAVVRASTPDSPEHLAQGIPSDKSLIWVGDNDKFWEVDGTPDEIEARIVACETQAIQTRGVDNKPMMYEEIAQLERSLLNEISAHDVTKRRLAAQEREIERLRSNLYKDRVKNQTKEKPDEVTDNNV